MKHNSINPKSKRQFYDSLQDLPCWEEVSTVTELFREKALLSSGLLSSVYSKTVGNPIFSDWDDVVPAFLMGGQYNFLLEQTFKAQSYLINYLPPLNGGILFSWRLDEWIAGLSEINSYQYNYDVYNLLEKSIASIEDNITLTSGLIPGVTNARNLKKHPVVFARTGGLFESLLGSSNPKSSIRDVVTKNLDWWATNEFFQTHKVFPSKWYANSKTLNYVMCSSFSERLKFSKGNSGAYLFDIKKWRTLEFLLYLPFQNVQLMKDNSNLIFAYVAAFNENGSDVYKNVVLDWCDSVWEKMLKNGSIHGKWSEYSESSLPTLAQNFTYIDILCDSYAFLEKKSVLLERATSLAKFWLNQRWSNGVIPSTPDGKLALVDEQTDFSVGLVRIAELTGNDYWKEAASELVESCKENFTNKDGVLVTWINANGGVEDPTITTKYNLLFSKALVAIHCQEKIYENEHLYQFLQDR